MSWSPLARTKDITSSKMIRLLNNTISSVIHCIQYLLKKYIRSNSIFMVKHLEYCAARRSLDDRWVPASSKLIFEFSNLRISSKPHLNTLLHSDFLLHLYGNLISCLVSSQLNWNYVCCSWSFIRSRFIRPHSGRGSGSLVLSASFCQLLDILLWHLPINLFVCWPISYSDC